MVNSSNVETKRCFGMVRQNQSGQITVEAILIGCVFAAIIGFVSNELQSSSWPGKMIKQPWGKISGMIESGVWSKRGVKGARVQHPNLNIKRRVSIKGTLDAE